MSEPKFVNRVSELNELENLARRGVTLPIYLYGPEGCGKTRLLREFVKRFNGVSIYIDALDKGKAKECPLNKSYNKGSPRFHGESCIKSHREGWIVFS